MGRRGPPRVPTEILAARGSWLADARKGKEPQIAVCVPECPEWVSESARKYWPELAGGLAAMGIMGQPYTIPLGLLVDALASYIAAKETLDKEGSCIETKQGLIAHPAASQAAGAWDRVLKAAKEFGMTPAAKGALRLGDGKPVKSNEKDKGRFFGTA